MYSIFYDIRIGGHEASPIESAAARLSCESLTQTCAVRMPAMKEGQAADIERWAKRGAEAAVRFGYEEPEGKGLRTEFLGYVSAVRIDDGMAEIEIEDETFLLRKKVRDRQYRDVEAKDLLKDVIGQTDFPLDVDCSYSFRYDSFVTLKATAYDVVEKVMQDSGAWIFITETNGKRRLRIAAPYQEAGEEVRYDFSKNIEKEDLEYRRAEERPLRVTVKGTDKDGRQICGEYGDDGGDTLTLDRTKGTKCTQKELEEMAKEAHAAKCFDGYEGSLVSWLLPVCRPCDLCRIADEEYPHREGVYYALSTEAEISPQGGRRTVSLGKRVR